MNEVMNKIMKMNYCNKVNNNDIVYRNETIDVSSLLDYILNFNENSRNFEKEFLEEIAA